MITCPFADEHAVSIAAHQIHDVIRDQTVIHHDVRLLDLLETLQRQQARIAGTCAHQYHFTAMIQRLAQELFGRLFNGFGVLIGKGLRQPVVDKELLPEATAFAHGCEGLLHAGTQLPGVLGNLAKMLRQHGFQFFPQQTGKNGRAATGRYRNHQRRAVDNGWHDKARLFRRIHHVTEDAARFAGVADALVNVIVIRCGDGQPAGIQQGFIKFALHLREHPFLRPDVKLWGEGEGVNGQSGARL